MTAADRNTTADALTEVADYHVTECVDMHGDQGEDGPGPDCCFHARAAYTVGDAARLLRTPDTPTDSDTAARARALLDAADTDEWWWHLDINDPAASALIAAAPTLITDLLAERDAAVVDAERNASMATEYAGKAVEYKQEREAAEAERDAAVARGQHAASAWWTAQDQVVILRAERDAAVASADERVGAGLALLHEARNERDEAERRERTAINIAKCAEAERDAAVARADELEAAMLEMAPLDRGTDR